MDCAASARARLTPNQKIMRQRLISAAEWKVPVCRERIRALVYLHPPDHPVCTDSFNDAMDRPNTI